MDKRFPNVEAMIATARDIEEAIKKRFPAPEWAVMFEVCESSGRRADAVAVNLWRSRGLAVNGFEIKRSRHDWLNEKKNPAKADAVIKHCDYFWVVTAYPEIILPGEIPVGWGHLTMRSNGVLRMLVNAARLPGRKSNVLNRGFAAMLIRRASQREAVDWPEKYSRALKEAMQIEETRYEERRKDDAAELLRLQEQVKTFEAASGIGIAHSWQVGNVGAIVHLLLSGLPNLDRVAREVESVARQFREASEEAKKLTNGQNGKSKR